MNSNFFLRDKNFCDKISASEKLRGDFMIDPKISVIIPMYNAEKYIRQCLISVLASKFKDYEVIVVDDCSKDNSVAEVEKLLPHFDGRLKILSTEKNSGGAGIPRNIGIKNAAGKYITFVDNDDMILPTTLENFFDVAEFYGADVVYAEKHFVINDDGQINGKNLKVRFFSSIDNLVEVPTLESNYLRERINRFISEKFFYLPWGKFYRRDFLIENKIDFPQMRFSEDLTFSFKCLCLAKKYVRIPHITNIRRELKNSTAKMIIDSQDGVRLWLKILLDNVVILEEFMYELDLKPEDRRDVLKFCIDIHFGMIKNLFQGLKPHEVQEIFNDELQNPELNPKGKNLVAAYLYSERVLTR